MNGSHRRGVPMRSAPAIVLVCLLSSSGLGPIALAADRVLRIVVDARDLPRKLLHTRVTIPCGPGTLRFWYPKWIPGTHAPSGPIDTVGGLRVEAQGGRVIAWQ